MTLRFASSSPLNPGRWWFATDVFAFCSDFKKKETKETMTMEDTTPNHTKTSEGLGMLLRGNQLHIFPTGNNDRTIPSFFRDYHHDPNRRIHELTISCLHNNLTETMVDQILDKRITAHLDKLSLRSLCVKPELFQRILLETADTITHLECSNLSQEIIKESSSWMQIIGTMKLTTLTLSGNTFKQHEGTQRLYSPWFGYNTTSSRLSKSLKELILNGSHFIYHYNDPYEREVLPNFIRTLVSLETISLKCCRLSHDATMAVIYALQTLTKLKKVDLGGNQACSWLNMGCIAYTLTIPASKHLTYLDLSYQRNISMDRSKSLFKQLAESISKPSCAVKVLRLAGNGIQDKHLHHLANVLASPNTRLECLDLSNNHITANGLWHSLLRKLVTNQHLKYLNVKHNQISNLLITDKDDQVLNDILEELKTFNYSLQGLDHSCRMVAYGVTSKLNYIGHINQGGRRLLRTSKPIPLGLWPDILQHASTSSCEYPSSHQDQPFVNADAVFYFLRHGPLLHSLQESSSQY